MPFYFFDLYTDTETRDELGQELPSDQAARAQGIQTVRAMLAEFSDGRVLNLQHRVDIRDGTGETLFRIRFGDVLTVHRRQRPL